MGCNMCVVNRPEEQYRVMFQKGCINSTQRPIDGNGHMKVKGRRLSQLPQERPPNSQDPLLLQVVRKGHQRKAGGIVGGTSALVPIADCVDNATQTDISFQNILPPGRTPSHHPPHGDGSPPPPPPSSPLPHLMEPYVLNEFCTFEHEYNDPNDYFDIAHHEVDRQEELEYEEVELYKSRQQDKLGLTVCYRTDDEEDLGIYVGEVNPNSIAAKNGRIREGDRILQINGVDIQNREEAVAILTREDSINFSLLLARPEIETENQGDPEELDVELPIEMSVEGFHTSHLPSLCRLRKRGLPGTGAPGGGEGGGGEEAGGERREPWSPNKDRDPPILSMAPLSNSQELDSGVGRTDESTRNEESSEHDLLGDEQTSAPNTNTTNTPGSMRKFRPGRSPGAPPRGDTPPLLHLREIHLSTDSLPGLDGGGGGGGGGASPLMMMMMPGLTEEECERYRELLEIRCQYERNGNAGGGGGGGGGGEEEGEAEEEGEGEGEGKAPLDTNCNESLTQHEMALLEEELRHLEFKCRNILRAQKMQQLRERCLKAWLLEEEAAASRGPPLAPSGPPDADEPPHHELSDINEVPERERSDKDSTSAYNTGGESCRSTPLVSTEQFPPLSIQEEGDSSASATLRPHTPSRTRDRAGRGGGERGHASFSPNSYKKFQTANASTSPAPPPKFRSLTRDGVSRRGVAEGGTMTRRSPKTNGAHDRAGGGRSAESSPYFTRRHRPLERYQSCMQLQSEVMIDCLDDRDRERILEEERGAAAGSSGPASPRSVNSAPAGSEDHHHHQHHHHHHPSPSRLPPLSLNLGPASPRMEWKVKIRSDGTRYVAKRPVRDRLLKARAIKIREERSGMTTDDDAVSEMKMGRYWSKEERKQQLLRAREQRRRREFMMQSRLDYLRGGGETQGEGSDTAEGKAGGRQGAPQEHNSILALSQRKVMKKRNRRILDNWITIQELLSHGSRSPDGKKVYNPLLSVTTV